MNSELTREWRKWHNVIVYETGRPPDYPAKVTFERQGVYTDQATGKPVVATTRCTYRAGQDR